jgi:hypothetical protein
MGLNYLMFTISNGIRITGIWQEKLKLKIGQHKFLDKKKTDKESPLKRPSIRINQLKHIPVNMKRPLFFLFEKWSIHLCSMLASTLCLSYKRWDRK